MTKKEYLQKLLEKLSEEWDFAKWLIIFLWNDKFDNFIIDKLYDYFSEKLKNIHDEKLKNRFSTTINVLNKMKNLEENDKISEDELNYLLNNV